MDKSAPSGLFVNDGSFMERFKQLQGEKGKEVDKSKSVAGSKPATVVPVASTLNLAYNKTPISIKANGPPKAIQTPSGGKLAFSLKQKSKLVAPPIKLGADEDEDENDGVTDSSDTSVKRQKVVQQDLSERSSRKINGAPTPPSDLTVKNVADKLATFVAKNGRHLEDMTRQRNPGDTPFKFLYDTFCTDYKYYEYRLAEEEKILSQAKDYQMSRSGSSSSPILKSSSASQRSLKHQTNYQTPASALYESADDNIVESGAPSGSDPIAMMEFYMKKAAQEEKRRQPRQSKDEMPPPACLQGGDPGKKGHHMGDFIPQEELEKFMASCHGVAAQKAAEKAKIQADNVGHKLLSKMGWKEGEGLGSSRSGIADPIMSGDVKKDNLGIGAHKPGEVSSEDDIYEQYKKRMMLGYRYRPNPLGNPRKSYY